MLTTAELAAQVGVTPRRLLAIAQARGVEPARIVGRSKLWKPKDAAKLAPGKPGRPKAG